MKKIVVGNLKMNLLTLAERDRYLESFQRDFEKLVKNTAEIVLCPPAVHLEKFVEKLKLENISVGAQNIFWEERGSFTGEISSLMVKNLGCNYIIIGHSERRKYFAENNEVINFKIRAALKDSLIPIVCVGESQEERISGETAKVISEQLNESLIEVPISKVAEIVFAYEPIWAVGSDVIPTGDEILKVKIMIKKLLFEKYGNSVAEKVRILYGGSVNSKNVAQVCLDPQLDGVLVGRESLVPSEFMKIVEIINDINP
ncbi:MAG: triose-phosphate isomerase [Candidatus Moranbacteria bacterium]|nr:triose-phosphate isomerase [Candidatus Moranbacteria bacterium]